METCTYLHHSLNKSGSKQAYSFPRSSRLPNSSKMENCSNPRTNHSFYNLPNIRSNRACSFGSGNKKDLAEHNGCPSPAHYRIKSVLGESKNSCIGFGESRDKVKFGNFLISSFIAKDIPAPNSYKLNLNTFSKKGGRISYRIKTEHYEEAPGPGSYHPKHLDLSSNGGFLLSNMKNEGSPRYYNPESPIKKKSSLLESTSPKQYSYQTRSEIFGKSVLSKFKSSVCGSFSKSRREGLIEKDKLQTPGFKYSSFSEFGDSKM